MNWKKLTLFSGVAVAAFAIPNAIAQDEAVAPVASSPTHVAPSSPSISTGRPSGHWRGGGDWRHRTRTGTVTSGDRHRWHGPRHHRWHRRHHHRRFYAAYPFGYPFGYPYGYGYGYPYWGASAALYYNGYRPRYTAYRADLSGRSVVVQVQQELARAGYYRGTIDGVIGNGTRRAIRAYERANGLPVDGRLDTQLLRTMGLA